MSIMKNFLGLFLLIIFFATYSQAYNRINAHTFHVSTINKDTVVLFIDYADPLVSKVYDYTTTIDSLTLRNISWCRYFNANDLETCLSISCNESPTLSHIITNFTKEKISTYSSLSINQGSELIWLKHINKLNDQVLFLVDKNEFEMRSLNDDLLVYQVLIGLTIID